MRALPVGSKRALQDDGSSSSSPQSSKESRSDEGYELAKLLLQDSFRENRELGPWYLSKPQTKIWVDAILERFNFPVSLSPRPDEPQSKFIERVAKASAQHVSVRPSDYGVVRNVVANAPVNFALPVEYRLCNSIERCGITYAIASALLPPIEQEGSIFLFGHRFSGRTIRCYRAGMGTGSEVNLPSLVAAVAGIVHEFLSNASNRDIFLLLKGEWPFVAHPNDSVMDHYQCVMNQLAAWDESGTLVQRLQRSVPLFESIWSGAHGLLKQSRARLFQVITTRFERTDLFVSGPGEYVDLGDPEGRYGQFEEVINTGTYAVVCSWKDKQGAKVAVRFAFCRLVDVKNLRCQECGVRDLVVHCAINPWQPDGHNSRASNVVRLLDHQSIVSKPLKFMKQDNIPAEYIERLSRAGVWQVSVMEAFTLRSHSFLTTNAHGDAIRSLVAQMVGFLFEAGHKHGFTHHDLSLGNIGGQLVPHSVKFLHYESANLWVPTSHSFGCLFKVYDFGMSRIGDQCTEDVGAAPSLARLETGYNPAADLLCLASSLCFNVIFPIARTRRGVLGRHTIEILSMIIDMLPLDIVDEEDVHDENEMIEISLQKHVPDLPTTLSAGAYEKVEMSAGEIFSALKIELSTLHSFLCHLIDLYPRTNAPWPSRATFFNAEADASNVFQRSFYRWGRITGRQREAVNTLCTSLHLAEYRARPEEATQENTWVLQ